MRGQMDCLKDAKVDLKLLIVSKIQYMVSQIQ
jgi:hypothetical protein